MPRLPNSATPSAPLNSEAVSDKADAAPARRLVREFRPDVVVGAGGYVSGPVLLTAAFMKRPTLVMDSNALPGFTNRRLARFVDKAAVSFAEAMSFFPGKAVLTGNPVRSEFFEVPAKTHDPQHLSLLVFGGSQGARAINEAMVAALAHLVSEKDRLRVTHQTGTADVEKVQRGYGEAGWSANAEVKAYIDDMVSEFARADLIVSRAGATTTAELLAAGMVAPVQPAGGAVRHPRQKQAWPALLRGPLGRPGQGPLPLSGPPSGLRGAGGAVFDEAGSSGGFLS